MKRYFFILSLQVFSSAVMSQNISGKLQFTQGQSLSVNLETKTTSSQQAMGQSIDFNVNATGTHSYKVTNTTDDNSTLHHQVQRITFSFDGMGQKKSFDSNEEKDLNGPFGKPVKDMLTKTYDIIIDSNGKVLMALPDKVELAAGDSRMAIITSMLKDVMDIVHPPQKGKASFFKVLPDKEASKGQAWTESYINENGKFDAAYTVTDITDSTIVVDFAATSITITKAEMMGSPTTTSMNNKSTGKIILDKKTGIMKEKTISTESNGNTEASFGTLPVTSKTTTTIKVTTLQ